MAATPPWFHVPSIPEPGQAVMLVDREAGHAARAKRLRERESIVLFDGRGRTARAVIAAILKKDRALEATVESVESQTPPTPPLHLACALPKSDRQSTLLNMATQLGMTSFTPLRTRRTVVDPGRNFMERAERVCREACKQSRWAWEPVIRPVTTLDRLIAAAGAGDGALWIAHPGGVSARDLTIPDAGVTVLIGPEGGFDPAEMDAARAAGADTVGLGRGVLRIETAAIAVIAAVRA